MVSAVEEIAKDFVVGVHVYLLWSLKRMKPLFQGQQNDQQLLFLDKISSFSRLHSP